MRSATLLVITSSLKLRKADYMTLKHCIFSCLIALSAISFAGGKFKVPPQQEASSTNKIPVFFHPDYDISLLGLEKLHPFDSCKYGKVFERLKNYYAQNRFRVPQKISDTDLLKVHAQEYLDSLSDSNVVARITEIPLLKYLPNFILQRYVLNPMRIATGGTVEAAQRALEDGWAINLSGGYHHAKHDCGGGFCAFADIPLAIATLWEKHPKHKVMIVDLDAHQGNGHESFFQGDERVVIYDIYNGQIYPQDHKARKRIDYNYPVKSGIKDAEYLGLLEDTLPAAIEESKPDFIIYNAGTDIFEKDPLGNMKISAAGIKKRDELVFSYAQKNNIPILMVLSGGYTQESSTIIGNSLSHILQNILKVK